MWELTSSGHGIENVEAGAGAGKTYALRVAVDAFAAAGHPVLSTSTSNLATRTLEHEADMRALNTSRHLDLDRGQALAPGTVLMVDEAGAPPLDEPPALYWELIAEDGEVVGVICPDCLTLREQRAIRAEQARVIRRLKPGLPL